MDTKQAYFDINFLADRGHLALNESETAHKAVHIFTTEGNLAAKGLALSLIQTGTERYLTTVTWRGAALRAA